MPQVHRNNDSRNCGAVTRVQNVTRTFVNSQLVAVDNSHNSHGQGGLLPSGSTVYVENKLIIVHEPDNSRPDNLCPVIGGPHCNPRTAQGSPNVFCY